jgi:hypothetical protein
LETRLPEAQLTGLDAAAKSASRPGLQFTVANTDLSPTLDEMEAGRAKLRETLLNKTQDELARVNKNSSGRTYRIGSIEYGAFGISSSIRPIMRSMAMVEPMMANAGSAASTPNEGDNLSVDQKIDMTATVTFATAVK